MSRFTLLLLAIAAVISCTIAQPTESPCPQGKQWNFCGSACPPTCLYPNRTGYFCETICVPRCECVGEGIVEYEDSCIPYDACPI